MANAIDAWLAAAIADAKQRGLTPLEPILTTLAKSTAALRAADAELRAAADQKHDSPRPKPPAGR